MKESFQSQAERLQGAEQELQETKTSRDYYGIEWQKAKDSSRSLQALLNDIVDDARRAKPASQSLVDASRGARIPRRSRLAPAVMVVT